MTSFDRAMVRDPPELLGSSGPRCRNVLKFFPGVGAWIPYARGRHSGNSVAGLESSSAALEVLFPRAVMSIPSEANVVRMVLSAVRVSESVV